MREVPHIPIVHPKKEKVKVFIIIGIGVLLFGILLWWLISPILMFQGQEFAGKGSGDSSSVYDELNAGLEATRKEEEYLDSVNQPVDSMITEADDSSLDLIRAGKLKYKDLDKKDGDSDSDYKSRPRVSTMGSMRSKLAEKLPQMRGLLGGGGGYGGGYGGSGRSYNDLSSDARRFGDKNWKGGNVVTGPAAAAKTTFGNRGPIKNLDPKFSNLEKAAAGAGSKFGEGNKNTSPQDVNKALGGSTPKDMSKDMKSPNDLGAKPPESQGPDAQDQRNQPERKQPDPLALLACHAAFIGGGIALDYFTQTEEPIFDTQTQILSIPGADGKMQYIPTPQRVQVGTKRNPGWGAVVAQGANQLAPMTCNYLAGGDMGGFGGSGSNSGNSQ